MRALTPSEDALTIAVVDYCRVKKGGREHVMHIPNEGKRSPRTAARLKRMGLTPGAADLFLPLVLLLRVHGELVIRAGLWLELKKAEQKPSAAQNSFLATMESLGYCVGWADNFEDAVELIESYLAPPGSERLELQVVDDIASPLLAFQPSGKPS